MIRSVLAVLAGIAALTVSSFAIEAVANPMLMRLFPQSLPDEAALRQNVPATLFLFTYSTLCVAGGGYVAAWLAPRHCLRHATIMGMLQVVLTVVAMFSFSGLAPLRNWLITIALTLPAAWCGGLLRVHSA